MWVSRLSVVVTGVWCLLLTVNNDSPLVHEVPSRCLLDGVNWSLHKFWNMLNPNSMPCLSNLHVQYVPKFSTMWFTPGNKESNFAANPCTTGLVAKKWHDSAAKIKKERSIPWDQKQPSSSQIQSQRQVPRRQVSCDQPITTGNTNAAQHHKSLRIESKTSWRCQATQTIFQVLALRLGS